MSLETLPDVQSSRARGSSARRLGAWFLGAGALLTAVACGGTSPEPKSSASADETYESEASGDRDTDPGEDGADTEPVAKVDPCADGTCFRCAESVCLSGWYCDEAAPGGPACSWLPDCAAKPSCRCLTKALGASCSCREEGGGLHVTCGG